MTPAWSILIATVPARAHLLARLLAQLAPAAETAAGQVEVIGLRNPGGLDTDGLAKVRQALLDEARGEWVSYADDDDQAEPGYIPENLAAMAAHPEADYIAWPHRYCHAYVPGAWQVVVSGLHHNGWHDSADAMVRDVTHIHPVRAAIARSVGWTTGPAAEDRRYTDGLRLALAGRSQVLLSQVLYSYRHDPASSVQYGTVLRDNHPGPLPPPPGPWFRWHPDSA